VRGPAEADEAASDATPSGLPGRRATSGTMLACAFAAVLLFSLAGLVPAPYAIIRPGPVYDTLSSPGGRPLIRIEGRPTYPTSGALDLTTVYSRGGPQRHVNVLDVLVAWADPTEAVLPERQVYPEEQTEQEAEDEAAQQMVSSQENATAAALHELGIPVPTTLTVVGFSEGSDASVKLAQGDVITAVDGEPVPDLPQLRARLQDVRAGGPATVTLRRDGRSEDVDVATLEGEEGQTMLGVLVDPTYDFPFDVAIEIEDVGGPSAGMMFALGIVDKLTPGAMTRGERVAGTGTIDSSGQVGPIGSIRQKLVGARRSGARYFLAPADNCPQVVGAVPDGLQVVSVGSLADARDAVEAIATGRAAGLPSCR
jgi:PDZ domain-containing protein